MSKRPVTYAAVSEANRRAQREVATSLGRMLKSEMTTPRKPPGVLATATREISGAVSISEAHELRETVRRAGRRYAELLQAMTRALDGWAANTDDDDDIACIETLRARFGQ